MSTVVWREVYCLLSTGSLEHYIAIEGVNAHQSEIDWMKKQLLYDKIYTSSVFIMRCRNVTVRMKDAAVLTPQNSTFVP